MTLFFGVQKILFPTDDFHFLFHRKNYSPLLLVYPLCPTYCTPTKSNLYLANSLAAAVSEPALYRLLTFHVPKKSPFSVACCVILPLGTLPTPEIQVEEQFTSGLFCLQRKHLAL